MVSRNARYRASNGPAELRFRSILKLRKPLLPGFLPPIVQRKEISKIRYLPNKYLPKRLLATTLWLCRLRLGVLFESIQLITPEFCEREFQLVTSRPRFSLSIALVVSVAISHIFSCTPSAGLESFLAGRNRPEAQSGERREGPFHAHIRLTVLAGEKIRRLVPINCAFRFAFHCRQNSLPLTINRPRRRAGASHQSALNTGRCSAMNVSSDFGGTPPIF